MKKGISIINNNFCLINSLFAICCCLQLNCMFNDNYQIIRYINKKFYLLLDYNFEDKQKWSDIVFNYKILILI